MKLLDLAEQVAARLLGPHPRSYDDGYEDCRREILTYLKLALGGTKLSSGGLTLGHYGFLAAAETVENRTWRDQVERMNGKSISFVGTTIPKVGEDRWHHVSRLKVHVIEVQLDQHGLERVIMEYPRLDYVIGVVSWYRHKDLQGFNETWLKKLT